jgi:hypothetical protein
MSRASATPQDTELALGVLSFSSICAVVKEYFGITSESPPKYL